MIESHPIDLQSLGKAFVVITGRFIPAAGAPSMHCLALIRFVVGRTGQAADYFPFFIAQFVPGPHCFFATLGTVSITVHFKLLCSVWSTSFSLLVTSQQTKVCTLNVAYPPETLNRNQLFTEAS